MFSRTCCKRSRIYPRVVKTSPTSCCLIYSQLRSIGLSSGLCDGWQTGIKFSGLSSSLVILTPALSIWMSAISSPNCRERASINCWKSSPLKWAYSWQKCQPLTGSTTPYNQKFSRFHSMGATGFTPRAVITFPVNVFSPKRVSSWHKYRSRLPKPQKFLKRQDCWDDVFLKSSTAFTSCKTLCGRGTFSFAWRR